MTATNYYQAAASNIFIDSIETDNFQEALYYFMDNNKGHDFFNVYVDGKLTFVFEDDNWYEEDGFTVLNW